MQSGSMMRPELVTLTATDNTRIGVAVEAAASRDRQRRCPAVGILSRGARTVSFTQADVRRAIKATMLCGLEVLGVTVLPDGSPLIMTKAAAGLAGPPEAASGETEGNSWDGVL